MTMRIEQIKSSVLRITMHTYECATLVAAARWFVEGAKGELPEEAIKQLREVLQNYDTEYEKSVKIGK
jgi:hypothetical protein